MNGDIKSAVYILNENKKFKMAQLVSQAVSTNDTKDALDAQMKCHPNFYANFNRDALSIC